MGKPIVCAALALMLIACACFSGGCALIGDRLNGLSQTEAPVTEPPGSGLETPVPDGAETLGSADENPVFSFFSGYFGMQKSALSGLAEAVRGSGSRGAASCYLELLSDIAQFTSVYSSAGMLPDGGELSGFRGTVAGACAGQGLVTDGGDIEFAFDGGGALTGHISGPELDFTVTGGDEDISVSARKSGGAYTVRVGRDGRLSLIEISPSGVRYALLPAGESLEAGLSFDALPEGARLLDYTGRTLVFNE